jgi:hypothetical protein
VLYPILRMRIPEQKKILQYHGHSCRRGMRFQRKSLFATRLQWFLLYLSNVKLLSIFLAVIFAVLTVYPCADDNGCTAEPAAEMFVHADHDHNSSDIDLCSPFCICSCCSVKMSQPSVFHFEALSPVYPELNSPTLLSVMAGVSHSIWQPPKLS